MKQDSVTEEQLEVIETAVRLKVACAWGDGLRGPWEEGGKAHRRGTVGCGHGNVAEHVGPNRRVKGLPDLTGGGRIKIVKYA